MIAFIRFFVYTIIVYGKICFVEYEAKYITIAVEKYAISQRRIKILCVQG